jgi:hypothetical protein
MGVLCLVTWCTEWIIVAFVGFSRIFLLGILMFKGLTVQRLYKSFDIKRFKNSWKLVPWSAKSHESNMSVFMLIPCYIQHNQFPKHIGHNAGWHKPHDISTTFWWMSVVHLLFSWLIFGRDNYCFIINYWRYIMKAEGGMQFCIKFTYFSCVTDTLSFQSNNSIFSKLTHTIFNTSNVHSSPPEKFTEL